MIRKVVGIILAILAVGTMCAGVVGYVIPVTLPPGAYGNIGDARQFRVAIRFTDGRVILSLAKKMNVQLAPGVLFCGTPDIEEVQIMPGVGLEKTSWVSVHIYDFFAPLWMTVVALGAYPVTAHFSGPFRCYRRRRDGLCVTCAYNLTGNTSGVCPECGTTIEPPAT